MDSGDVPVGNERMRVEAVIQTLRVRGWKQEESQVESRELKIENPHA
jgi:hypothetical protein